MSNSTDFESLKEQLTAIAHYEKSAAVLQWDQEVNMPNKGADLRGQQLAFLSQKAHDLTVSDELTSLVDRLKGVDTLDDFQKRNLRRLNKAIEKEKRLPSEFVYRMSKTVSEAYQSWLKARQETNFSHFKDALKKVVDLNLEKAQYYGYQDHPYDALLDDFEPDLTLKEVDKTFQKAKPSLQSLLKKIQNQPVTDQSFLKKDFDKKTQVELSRQVARDLGFDFEAGRLDISEHPFTISMHPEDVRITTRMKPNDFTECLWSTIHETGHALYEQGLSKNYYGFPAGDAISMGIHESQARLWENNVGKSYEFVKAYLPIFREYFPDQFQKVSEQQFYQALNHVKPNLIRTAADEVTYHFHIIIRFELEKAMVEQKVDMDELPDFWNEKYRKYLGLEVPSVKQGILQDVHWAHGAIGYFPTYSLGSFYAAQFYHKAKNDLFNLEGAIAKRNFKPLLDWLRQNLHQYGHTYNSREICEKITGEPLNFDYFERYVWNKYDPDNL